jgi:Fimbrial assembly protein (PilN)
MIKVNLLESVTDRPTGAARVEDKVSSPLMQTLLMGLTVFGLLIVGSGYDYISANAAREVARIELENQKRINQQMLAVNQEKLELERKAQDIQSRIDAIKRLRDSQQGPGSVLREIKSRFDAVPGLYLKSIEQKESELIVKGESPNEASVTKFGQSMEFSSGLFTNLLIETQKELAKGSASPTGADGEVVPTEIITFTVKCNFAKSQIAQTANAAPNSPANQVALKK